MKLRILKVLCCCLAISLYSVDSHSQIWKYEVKKGDTLWDIADEYMIDVFYYKRLQKINKIKNPYLLQPGRTITAPVNWLGSLPGKANLISKFGHVVVIKNNVKKISPTLGYQIEVKDKFITGQDSTATIEFSDGSILSVYPGTNLEFNALLQSHDGSVVKARMVVSQGRVDIDISDEKVKGRRLEIESPSAVTAVRGTVFRVGVDSESKDTVTEVVSGKVDITNTQSNQKISVGSGLGSKTGSDSQSIPPIALLAKPLLGKSKNTDDQLGSLTWKKIDSARYYRVRVATDEDFINTIYNKITVHNRADDIYFLQNGTHYVSVRAADKNDIEGFDSITTITVNAYPLPPLIVTPLIYSISQRRTPTFGWQILDGQVRELQFQLAQDKQFESILVDEIFKPTNRYKLKEKLEKGRYFWRIASIDETGRGGYSNPAVLNVK